MPNGRNEWNKVFWMNLKKSANYHPIESLKEVYSELMLDVSNSMQAKYEQAGAVFMEEPRGIWFDKIATAKINYQRTSKLLKNSWLALQCERPTNIFINAFVRI